MRRNLFITLVAGTALILASISAWHERRLSRAATLAREVVMRQQSETQAALRHVQEWREAAPRGEETDRAAATTAGAEAPSGPTNRDPWEVARTRSPELQVLRLAAERARLQTTYEPLFRALKLTPAQAAQFCEHKMRCEEQKSDLNAAAGVQGLSEHYAAVRRLTERAGREYEDAQHALLGDAGARQAIEFEHTLPARETVASIAATAALAGVPLTAEQAERLLRVIVDAAPRLSEGFLDADRVDWVAADAQARGILTPAQFALFASIETEGLGRFSGGLHQAMDRARRSDEERAVGAR